MNRTITTPDCTGTLCGSKNDGIGPDSDGPSCVVDSHSASWHLNTDIESPAAVLNAVTEIVIDVAPAGRMIQVQSLLSA